jgi:hypothetical protein
MEKTVLNKVGGYFDLQSESRAAAAQEQTKGNIYAPVLPQYAAVCLGVIAEPYLRHYINSGFWEYDGQNFISRIVFGLVVSIIILPGVYKSSFDPGKPIAVQLAALFPIGIGWQSLVASAAKIAVGGG